MDLRDWQAEQWGAFGQVGALVVAAVAGYLVWRQVKHTAQAREDQTRPYVIVDFEFRGSEVVIVVRNIGSSPAVNVQTSFDRPLRSHVDMDPDELAVFTRGVPMLAPGRTISIPFGWGPKFFDDDLDVPLRYEATVTYEAPGRAKAYQDPPLILDLLPYKHTLIEQNDLQAIHQSLRDIKNLMKSWTSEQRLRVNTVTQAEVSAGHQAAFDRRKAEREARAAVTEES